MDIAEPELTRLYRSGRNVGITKRQQHVGSIISTEQRQLADPDDERSIDVGEHLEIGWSNRQVLGEVKQVVVAQVNSRRGQAAGFNSLCSGRIVAGETLRVKKNGCGKKEATTKGDEGGATLFH